jgi:polysaccharide biosynthesis protein PelB
MKTKELVGTLLWCLALGTHAKEMAVTGRDYLSLQIASSTDVDALKRLYDRYSHLPYLRLETRGQFHVLRAGFWDTRQEARKALAGTPIPGASLRTAVLRTEALVLQNWDIASLTDDSANAPTLSAAPALGRPAPLPIELSPAAPPPQHPRLPTPITTPLPVGAPMDPTDKFRIFNQENFDLAYDVMLATGDIQSAFRIAQRAVEKRPQDEHWRRRLAQVAEWTQRPAVAAAQWRVMFLQGNHAPDVLAMVLRFSPFMEDPSVALQVWQTRAQRENLTSKQWLEIFQLYEELAQPSEASAYFEAQYRRYQDITLLEYAARLAEYAGNDQRALSLLLQRAGLEPFSIETVLRAVTYLVRMDRLPEAQSLMQVHASRIPPYAAEYWRMLGQIAWETRSLDTAQDAYGRYVKTPQATAADWSRLVFLVRQKYPLQAAALALEAWRRFEALDQLNLALELYANAGEMLTLGRIYKSLQGDALAQAQQQPRFLLLRAQYYQRSKQADLAWADLKGAMRLAPRDKDVQLSALWFLIDEGRAQTLAALLQEYAGVASKDSGYWLAFAAANQTLGRQREALHWYAKEVRRTPEAPLLLLNYADTLEQLQQAGMAARIRRHAWLILQQRYPDPDAVPTATSAPELLATARLALLNRPGDAAQQQIRQLVRKLRGLPSGQTDADASALVLGWAMAQEQYQNARLWMWQRYTRQADQTAPLWAESQLALQSGDTASMQRFMDHNSEALSIYTRHDMASALGHTSQALDIAFQGMARQEGDEALHDRFRQNAPANAAYLQLQVRKERLDTLDRQGLQGEARLPVAPNLNLLAGWGRMQQSSSDPVLQSLAPGADQLERLELQWGGTRDPGSLAILHRNEIQSYYGLQWAQSFRWGQRISLDAGLNYRADSTLSLPLQVAGYEHSAYGSLSYTLDKRVYLRATPRVSQYYTQFGDYLGSGRMLDFEAGYRIRTEYPDWRVRALLSQQDFSRDGAIGAESLARLPADLQTSIASGAINAGSYFVPESSTAWGLCLTMGENLAGQNLQTVYSRGWRPYVDVCLRDNTLTGSGYSATAGLVGSLTGEDHIAIEYQNGNALTNVGGPTHSLTLRYRRYF